MDRLKYNKMAMALVDQMTVEEAASQLLHASPEIKRLGISKYNWWNEALHGVGRSGTATVFPQAIAMAATFDSESMKALWGLECVKGHKIPLPIKKRLF